MSGACCWPDTIARCMVNSGPLVMTHPSLFGVSSTALLRGMPIALACDISLVCFLLFIGQRSIDGRKGTASHRGRERRDQRPTIGSAPRLSTAYLTLTLAPRLCVLAPFMENKPRTRYADWRVANQFRNLWWRTEGSPLGRECSRYAK
jgi:hypothetical protein